MMAGFARRMVGAYQPPAGDPFWADVELYLPMMGANGSTSFPDLSVYGRTMTAVGNAQISTATSPAGTSSSGLFDGAGDRLSTTDDLAALDLGFGALTFDWFMRRTATKTNALVCSTAIDGSASLGYWLDFPGGNFQAYCRGTLQLSVAVAAADSTWQHWEFCRDGAGESRLYRAGILQASNSAGVAEYSAPNFRLGGTEFNSGFDLDFNGNIAHFRVTRACRHTANFTPPVPPFPTY